MVIASEREMLMNDQVVSMEVLETNNAVTQFVGDNIDLNIGNTSFHSMSHLSDTTVAKFTYNSRCPHGEVEGTRQC